MSSLCELILKIKKCHIIFNLTQFTGRRVYTGDNQNTATDLNISS